MKGYDNIPTDDSLYGHFFIDETDPQYYLQHFRNKLSGLGFFQHYSNSLQDKTTSNLFSNNSISMLNPLSNKMAHLRTSLYPGLLKAAELNIKNSTNSLKLYELGTMHSQNGKKLGDMFEEIKLTGIILGYERINSVHHENEDYDIFFFVWMLNQFIFALFTSNLMSFFKVNLVKIRLISPIVGLTFVLLAYSRPNI